MAALTKLLKIATGLWFDYDAVLEINRLKPMSKQHKNICVWRHFEGLSEKDKDTSRDISLDMGDAEWTFSQFF